MEPRKLIVERQIFQEVCLPFAFPYAVPVPGLCSALYRVQLQARSTPIEVSP
jgi:hypothetical protein